MKKAHILLLCLSIIICLVCCINAMKNSFSSIKNGEYLYAIKDKDVKELNLFIIKYEKGQKCNVHFTHDGFEGAQFVTDIVYDGKKIMFTYIFPAQENSKGETYNLKFDSIYKIGPEYHLKNSVMDICIY